MGRYLIGSLVVLTFVAGCGSDEQTRYKSARQLLTVIDEKVIDCQFDDIDRNGRPESCAWDEEDAPPRWVTRAEAHVFADAREQRKWNTDERRAERLTKDLGVRAHDDWVDIQGDRWFVTVLTTRPELADEIASALGGEVR